MALLTEQKLALAIKAIGASLSKWRENVQEVLINVAYQAMRGNPNYGNDLLRAITTDSKSAAHLQGITRWCETFAPLRIKEGRFVINKVALKSISVANEAEFTTQFEPTMRAMPWWQMGEKQRPESIFDAGTFVPNRLAAVAKKLNSEGFPELAAEVSELLRQLYSTAAWKAATTPATSPEPAYSEDANTIEGESVRIGTALALAA